MELVAHTGFIVAAYAAAGAVVGGLVAWVMLDRRAQLRTLAEFERRGVTRRSAASGEAVSEPAKEQA